MYKQQARRGWKVNRHTHIMSWKVPLKQISFSPHTALHQIGIAKAKIKRGWEIRICSVFQIHWRKEWRKVAISLVEATTWHEWWCWIWLQHQSRRWNVTFFYLLLCHSYIVYNSLDLMESHRHSCWNYYLWVRFNKFFAFLPQTFVREFNFHSFSAYGIHVTAIRSTEHQIFLFIVQCLPHSLKANSYYWIFLCFYIVYIFVYGLFFQSFVFMAPATHV